MHCKSCDVILTDLEACHKDKQKEYPDMCFNCLNKVMLAEYYGRYDDAADAADVARMAHLEEPSDG